MLVVAWWLRRWSGIPEQTTGGECSRSLRREGTYEFLETISALQHASRAVIFEASAGLKVSIFRSFQRALIRCNRPTGLSDAGCGRVVGSRFLPANTVTSASNRQGKADPLKLLVQPGDGVSRLVKGIRKAKKNLEIVIFRFDRDEIERAIVEAVEKGVFVHTMIAFTNRGGEDNLRRLELHLLEKGVSVARTSGDLVRYHGKMILVDRKELYVLGFNFTHLDMDHSRSFGLITRNVKLVQEACKVFEADTQRQTYAAGYSKFLVSPVNARNELAKFLKGAKKELLIYDPKISDRAMLRVLGEQKNAGVEIRVIGEVAAGYCPLGS